MATLPLPRFDPRAKFLALLLTGLQVVFAGSPLQLGVPGGIILAGLIAVRWSPREMLRLIRSVAWLGLFIVGANALTTPGVVAVTGLGLSLTLEGLATGTVLFGKVLLLLLLSRVFALSTPLTQMIDALDTATGRVRRVVQPLLTLLGITLGLAPMLVRVAQQVRRSYLARGGRTGLFSGLRFARVAAVPIVVSAFRSADHLADAMEARGFAPRGERTPFRRIPMAARDWVLVACVAGVTVSILL